MCSVPDMAERFWSAIGIEHQMPDTTLTSVPDHAPTLQEIKDFVREEVARQLSLIPFTQQPPSSRLPSPLRDVIAEEVAQAVPVAAHQQPVAVTVPHAPAMQPVAAPLTYAQVDTWHDIVVVVSNRNTTLLGRYRMTRRPRTYLLAILHRSMATLIFPGLSHPSAQLRLTLPARQATSMDASCRDQLLSGLNSTLPPSEPPGNCTALPGLPNDSCCSSTAEDPGDGWIFDRFEVKVTLVVAYSMVFCCCFFGNLLVIGVVIMNRRMRTTTNFFLTNLAVADLCVAMFCVYQNLFFYLTPQWVLGDFLCRMYFFVHGLSYTASILILTVICAERYLAIVHPMLNKQVVTMTRLRVTIVTLWIVSAAYCSPRIVMYGTVEAIVDDKREALCVLQRALYDSKTYDLEEDSEGSLSASLKLEYAQTFVTTSNNAREPCSATTVTLTMPYTNSAQRIIDDQQLTRTSSGCNRSAASALRPRRKVIRLLVAVVLSFALCNLPFHARKLWQHWSKEYNGSSPGAAILTILTNLVLYLNSGINPFLYALFSRNFRQCMADVLFCRNHRFRSKSRSSFIAMSKSLNSHASQGTPQAAHQVHGHRQAMQQQHL
ncbi:hypothetical protein HPB51_022120 [Rhipicephalus microplus]|uniref:G-protein coupled receptors family 1 profile domain-containing protein n=1 Tax=Rhipicephalus microplus TaxID=6941 RepID=A0A9J6ECB0_RHIMP|nr:hypothetical protein HPB51_022120 [Rhipicephalus microplus]